jgi:hypothetical protein
MSWLKAGYAKSANWISAMGSTPFSAMPIERPTMLDSASGVSSTRSGPKRASMPSVARKTPPSWMSSPRTMTDCSRSISSNMASWIASM